MAIVGVYCELFLINLSDLKVGRANQLIEKRATAPRSNQRVAQSDPSGCSRLMKMTLLVIQSATWTQRRNRNDKVERLPRL